MGVSTDAILGWGYTHFDDGSVEDLVAANTGEEYEDLWDEIQAAERRGVVIGTHCHYAFPMVFVSIRAAHASARRGNPQELDQHHFEQGNHEEWKVLLQREMEAIGLPIPDEEPGWFICSDWG